MIGVRIVHSLLHTSFFLFLTGVLCLLAHARLRRLRVREEIRVAHLQDVSSHASARLEALLCPPVAHFSGSTLYPFSVSAASRSTKPALVPAQSSSRHVLSLLQSHKRHSPPRLQTCCRDFATSPESLQRVGEPNTPRKSSCVIWRVSCACCIALLPFAFGGACLCRLDCASLRSHLRGGDCVLAHSVLRCKEPRLSVGSIHPAPHTWRACLGDVPAFLAPLFSLATPQPRLTAAAAAEASNQRERHWLECRLAEHMLAVAGLVDAWRENAAC